MARLKTKGDLIPLRLPLPIDAMVRERAEAAGLSPSVWLAMRVSRFMVGEDVERAAVGLAPVPKARHAESNMRTPPVDERQPRPRVPMKVPGCTHGLYQMVGGGLRKCTRCGAVRGADGVWR
jgi:hypothetical protein